ncbi:hypothetical protein QBC41DRAFT_360443 [Cercophora samala]|uniref:DUF4238 domain-containing protein n=1 Tax=Cercophora samala TaxID=330535 RepID=A0AA40D1C0_9PEZI|nr:hypothetical protein QBC41DRAFT_360443 [Cercophora samala]
MASQTPQYQHFVPRFLLRNFSHPCEPEGGTKKRKFEKGMFPKDPVVRHVDLTLDPSIICEKPVSRILGQNNMYDNPNKPTALQREVETLLSKLEAQASQVFHKISKAFDDKKSGLWISRAEHDVMRKFLFLLMYRNSAFYKVFNHETPEGYNEADKDTLRYYMRKNNIASPLDVWLHSIKTIINLQMDTERKWVRPLMDQIYIDHALWFWMHAELFYIAIVTPAMADEEFILTDHSYGIFEGANRDGVDFETGQFRRLQYTELNKLAPISPRLMIVLRSYLFPALPEGHRGPGQTQDCSLLEDLPVEKAKDVSTRVVNGRVEEYSSEPWELLQGEKFLFRFFHVKTKHVHIINSLLLDNCARCTSVIFESQEAFARSLEWYLSAPSSYPGKTVAGPDIVLKEQMLKKLEAISHLLGSKKDAVWERGPEHVVGDLDKLRLRHIEDKRGLAQLMERDPRALHEEISQQSTKLGNLLNAAFYEIYGCLGGTWQSLREDMFQVEKMLELRVKIDQWAVGVNDSIKQRNRRMLEEAYLRLSPQRVWLYIKSHRLMILDYERAKDSTEQLPFDGPEDTIARVHWLVKPGYLNRLLWRTHVHYLDRKRGSHHDPWLFPDGTDKDKKDEWLKRMSSHSRGAAVPFLLLLFQIIPT